MTALRDPTTDRRRSGFRVASRTTWLCILAGVLVTAVVTRALAGSPDSLARDLAGVPLMCAVSGTLLERFEAQRSWVGALAVGIALAAVAAAIGWAKGQF
jgi:hypothetical protein